MGLELDQKDTKVEGVMLAMGRRVLLVGTYEGRTLTLKGERKLEMEENRENYHRVELSYGTFTRGFSLPASIDAEKIRAESKHGVLLIHLPKKPEAKPKSIQVKVN